jgi:DNA-damage-inducible protein D
MSVPSPKAEPLRMWLAEQGQRTIEETEQPELGIQRNLEYYKTKGYPDEWIKERLKAITTRTELTDEWKNRGVIEGKEYSILTAIIAKGTFGLNPSEHKKLKSLTKPSQDLRDNMTDLELIFTALGEATTRRLAVKEDAQGFDENRDKAVNQLLSDLPTQNRFFNRRFCEFGEWGREGGIGNITSPVSKAFKCEIL